MCAATEFDQWNYAVILKGVLDRCGFTLVADQDMQHILAKRHLPTLANFVASNVLVAFDFDGTLAPIVRDPAAARMRRSTRRLLGSVARRYPCVVISGRARLDLAKRVRSLSIVHLAGNHGLAAKDDKSFSSVVD